MHVTRFIYGKRYVHVYRNVNYHHLHLASSTFLTEKTTTWHKWLIDWLIDWLIGY